MGVMGRVGHRLASLVYAAIVGLERAGRGRRMVACGLGAVVVIAAMVAGWCGGGGVRVATFNIESFRRDRTDVARLAELLEQVDADVIAVQEIEDPGGFGVVVERLGVRDRRYRLALSQCG